MMKHEFEKIINTTVSYEDYTKIETAYMTFDYLFVEKEDMAEFYMLNGITAVERLLKEAEYMKGLQSTLNDVNGRNTTLHLELIRIKRLLTFANMTIAGLKEENERLRNENHGLNRALELFNTLISEILDNEVCHECEADKYTR